MSVIDRINGLLTEKGISAAKMSKDLGFSSGLYSQWKKGLQKPSVSKIDLIAEYFNVSTDYLLGKSEMSMPADELTEDETKLLSGYRALEQPQKDLILHDIELLNRSNESYAKAGEAI